MKKMIVCLVCIILPCFLSLQAQEIDPLVVLREEMSAFKQEYPHLQSYSCEELAQLANQWEEKVAHRLSLTKPIRKINPNAIVNMLKLMRESQPKIFMRHGEQAKDERILNLNPSLQKIEMMRAPDNHIGCLTPESAAELVGSLIAWDYLQQKTQRNFLIQTSKNKRAKDVAVMLAFLLSEKLMHFPIWDCIDYPSEAQMKAEQILEVLPDGTLPWDENTVDKIVGMGSYARINGSMQEQLAQNLNEQTVLLAVTHTQQLNALALCVDLPLTRLGNYGFIIVTKTSVKLFPNGLY